MTTRLDHILAILNVGETSTPAADSSTVATAKEFKPVAITAAASPTVLGGATNIWASVDLTAGDVTLYLPENPSIGDMVIVEDAKLLVGTGNVLTINGGSYSIDETSQILLDTIEERGAVLKLRFNGTIWKIN